jgi:hypothetical protein
MRAGIGEANARPETSNERGQARLYAAAPDPVITVQRISKPVGKTSRKSHKEKIS